MYICLTKFIIRPYFRQPASPEDGVVDVQCRPPKGRTQYSL